MFPEVHGAVGLVATGCRDYSVYVWRRRHHKIGREENSRSMRGISCTEWMDIRSVEHDVEHL